MKILVIEDNADDQALIALWLRRGLPSTTHLVTSTTLSAAEAILATEQVDAVVLDIGLPDATHLSGLAMIQRVSPQAPVIIVTGAADESVAQEAIRSGAQDYLAKERLTQDRLVTGVTHAVERQARLQRLLSGLAKAGGGAPSD
jgi:DNA-binding NtrC family response regulator